MAGIAILLRGPVRHVHPYYKKLDPLIDEKFPFFSLRNLIDQTIFLSLRVCHQSSILSRHSDLLLLCRMITIARSVTQIAELHHRLLWQLSPIGVLVTVDYQFSTALGAVTQQPGEKIIGRHRPQG
jgi:hypothetical protein